MIIGASYELGIPFSRYICLFMGETLMESLLYSRGNRDRQVLRVPAQIQDVVYTLPCWRCVNLFLHRHLKSKCSLCQCGEEPAVSYAPSTWDGLPEAVVVGECLSAERCSEAGLFSCGAGGSSAVYALCCAG